MKHGCKCLHCRVVEIINRDTSLYGEDVLDALARVVGEVVAALPAEDCIANIMAFNFVVQNRETERRREIGGPGADDRLAHAVPAGSA